MEDTSGLEPGQLVFSKAGRDWGRSFLVVRVLDDRFVTVADGDLRKIGDPKRKNVRHLRMTERRAESIGSRLAASQPVKNWEIRQAIDELVGGSGEQ